MEPEQIEKIENLHGEIVSLRVYPYVPQNKVNAILFKKFMEIMNE